MYKQEFLNRLREGLAGLPQEDVRGALSFYGELIEDRIEEGLSEAEAVAGLGPPEELVAQTVAETPLPRLVRERVRTGRRLRGWELTLLILSFPLWFPLLIAAGAVLLSLYIVLWSLVVSLIAVTFSCAVGTLGSAAGCLFYLSSGAQAMVLLGAGLVLAGLSILLFFASKTAIRGGARLTKGLALWVKSLFLRKEHAE